MVGGLLLVAAADGLDRLRDRVVLGLNRFLVGVEPALVGDQVDHRTDDVGVALLERTLRRRGVRRSARAGGAGIDEAIRAFGPQRDGVRELGEREAVDRLTVHVHAAVGSDLHLSLRGDDDRSAAATDQAITVLRGEKSVLIAYERAVAGVAQRAGAGAEREEPGAGERDVEVVAGRGERALLEDRRRVVD